MKTQALWFYHVTAKRNLPSINALGALDPKFAKSDKKVVWLVTYGYVDWAIGHILYRGRLPLCEMAIVLVQAPSVKRGWGNMNRMFYCEERCPIERSWTAREWLAEVEMRQSEIYAVLPEFDYQFDFGLAVE
jgi:hypothetical protein